MLIIPAIDLQDNKVVRLQQGKRGRATVYAQDALAVAEQHVASGATRLHVVDLNGAFAGKPMHFAEIARIAKSLSTVTVQVGGGIRTLATLQKYFDCGVTLCILGTASLNQPDIVRAAGEKYPGRVILGLDARDGFVATEGWEKVGKKSVLDVAKTFAGSSLESLIYTDIAKDGMMGGVNLQAIKDMRACGFPLIASGGVSSLDDLKALHALGIYGVIVGKAIYEHAFDLREALRLYA